MSEELRSRGPIDAGEVSSFGDALALAFELSDQFRFAHTAVMLDASGDVRDMTVFAARDRHTVTTALEWAGCMTFNDEAATRILLVSVGDDPVTGPVREEDIRTFEKARDSFAKLGVDVVDWMTCDGNNVRSIALAMTGSDPWER